MPWMMNHSTIELFQPFKYWAIVFWFQPKYVNVCPFLNGTPWNNNNKCLPISKSTYDLAKELLVCYSSHDLNNKPIQVWGIPIPNVIQIPKLTLKFLFFQILRHQQLLVRGVRPRVHGRITVFGRNGNIKVRGHPLMTSRKFWNFFFRALLNLLPQKGKKPPPCMKFKNGP